MEQNNNNYQKGHRQRTFQKFLETSIEDIPVIDIIEICLFLAVPRKNMKPTAHLLKKKFPYFYLLLGAPKEDLLSIEGVGEQVYLFFKLILSILQYTQKEKVYNKEKFFHMEDIISYCKWKMCYLTHEELRILYFNSKNQLIKDEVQNIGSINSVMIYPREIIKKCLQLGAVSIVLCHNHPSGDATPSKEDITSTLNLQKVTNLLNIYIYDHIIIGDNNYFSMKKQGILP